MLASQATANRGGAASTSGCCRTMRLDGITQGSPLSRNPCMLHQKTYLVRQWQKHLIASLQSTKPSVERSLRRPTLTTLATAAGVSGWHDDSYPSGQSVSKLNTGLDPDQPSSTTCSVSLSTNSQGSNDANGVNANDQAQSPSSSEEPTNQSENTQPEPWSLGKALKATALWVLGPSPLLPPVPWGWGKIVQVMVLWLLAYIVIGQVAVPIGLSVLGLDRDELSARGHALLHLGLDLSQLGVTLGILWGCLRQFRPRKRGLFPMQLESAWTRRALLVVAIACCTFPGVDWVAQQSMSWFPVDGEGWAGQMEASLTGGDWVTNLSYFSVVSIIAPVWEELIFRGFLLTSLSRYMSPWAAAAASSLFFAMCHSRMPTFPPLLLLGVMFSAAFMVTRSLLPPIVIHSLWNLFVLANLLCRPG